MSEIPFNQVWTCFFISDDTDWHHTEFECTSTTLDGQVPMDDVCEFAVKRHGAHHFANGRDWQMVAVKGDTAFYFSFHVAKTVETKYEIATEFIQ